MIKKKRGKKALLNEEKNIIALEKKDLKELEKLKKNIEKDIGIHPLNRLAKDDVIRSIVGALVGTIGHFAFFYGAEIAERISVARAGALYFFSLVICSSFIYYSGFRRIKEVRINRFIPIRIVIIYLTSLVVTLGTLFIFNFINSGMHLVEIYKILATSQVLAVLGASIANILGGGE